MNKNDLLKKYWGYDRFRPMQQEVIDSVVAGHDTLVLMPTGGGKSLCYQLPALMTEGMCLVVSPLIALMKDQVHGLNQRGIKSACVVSGMSKTDVQAVLLNSISGTVKMLYVSPERLRQRMFIEHLRKMKVGLIAVDEAHCVSQWGYDFRPPYLQIADIRQYHPDVPLIALTASATPAVEADIAKQLGMRDCKTFRSSYARPNLCYRVVKTENKTDRLLRIARTVDGCGIVYTRSRRSTQQIAALLGESGISADYYHAGLAPEERDRRQALWMNNTCRVMVATNAFGMGIDKPDVRFVVHIDIPDSLEAYYQEAGRAGRDGKKAYAVALYSATDDERLSRDFASAFPSEKYIRNVYRALCNYYQLPIGSGQDSRHDFDIAKICSAYGLSERDFYSACRFLERMGLIALPEREDAYSTLFIPLGREELYRFQVERLRYSNLLQALVRTYPGLFSSSVSIDERVIGKKAMLETGEVIAMLSELGAMHVIEYRPRPQKPQIIFASECVDEKSIRMDGTSYDFLKDSARQRLQAVLDYMNNNSQCRARQLSAYFGETEGVADCGVCDVCTKNAKPALSVDEAVANVLMGGSMPLRDLCGLLQDEGYADAVDDVRQMLDEGFLHLDKNFLVSLS